MATTSSEDSVRKAIPFLTFLTIVFAVAFVGFEGTLPGLQSGWYRSLNKPGFTPPEFVFGPVWTVLYMLIGFAGWRVWQTESKLKTKALWLYGIQLFLNGLWSWLFFYWNKLGLASIEVVLLVLTIYATTAVFFKINRQAGWLMVPYAAWCTFATLLTIAVWRLN